MKITLDHNCIIHLADKTPVVAFVSAIVTNKENQCFVVNIGASEMRKRGVQPDQYNKFEELLFAAQIDHLPRLDPMGISDITFWDRCIWADDKMIQLADEIGLVLFGSSASISLPTEGVDSPAGKKWLNRLCDVHSMWCHIQAQNDLFLTSDGNFTKKTKLPRLLALGARQICTPNEFMICQPKPTFAGRQLAAK